MINIIAKISHSKTSWFLQNGADFQFEKLKQRFLKTCVKIQTIY